MLTTYGANRRLHFIINEFMSIHFNSAILCLELGVKTCFKVLYIFIDPWKTLEPKLVAAELWLMECEWNWWVRLLGLTFAKLLNTFLPALFPFWLTGMEISSGDLTGNVPKMIEPPFLNKPMQKAIPPTSFPTHYRYINKKHIFLMFKPWYSILIFLLQQ